MGAGGLATRRNSHLEGVGVAGGASLGVHGSLSLAAAALAKTECVSTEAMLRSGTGQDLARDEKANRVGLPPMDPAASLLYQTVDMVRTKVV